jgi:hypothetical protein
VSQLLPGVLVDGLPERLWSLGNLYQFFGKPLHFCVGGGVRTIEIEGREVAHGRKPFLDFHSAESTESGLRRYGFDLGWLVVGAVGLWIAAAALAARILRRPDGDLRRR